MNHSVEVEQIAEAFRKGKENLVSFKRLFLPVGEDEEVPYAWFYYTGRNTMLSRGSESQQRVPLY